MRPRRGLLPPRIETGEILIEAPNWSLDGASLFVNGHGLLWCLDLGSMERGLVRIDFEDLPELNNDHVLDPDGEHISMSAMDGTSIAVPSRAARWIGSHLMTAIGTISMVCRRTDPGLPTSRSATSPILEDSH
jgi:hypothetical protein